MQNRETYKGEGPYKLYAVTSTIMMPQRRLQKLVLPVPALPRWRGISHRGSQKTQRIKVSRQPFLMALWYWHMPSCLGKSASDPRKFSHRSVVKGGRGLPRKWVQCVWPSHTFHISYVRKLYIEVYMDVSTYIFTNIYTYFYMTVCKHIYINSFSPRKIIAALKTFHNKE